MAVLKFRFFVRCGRNRSRAGRKSIPQLVSRNVNPGSRRANDSAQAQRLLGRIRDDLQGNVQAITGSIQELVDEVFLLSSTSDLTRVLTGGVDQRWVKIRQEYQSALSSIRNVASQGRLHIEDTLEQASGFYSSNASQKDKMREITCLTKSIEEFSVITAGKTTRFTTICRQMILLAGDCLKPGSIYSDQKMRARLEALKSKALELIERPTFIGHDANATVEQVGIVKALLPFVKAATYREVLEHAGRTELPGVFSDPSPESATMKINIITAFTDVGGMLRDDIGDVQIQYDSYAEQGNLKAYGGIFNFLLGLYRCYAEALGSFTETCAKIKTT